MDNALARNGDSMTPTNEFSSYHFFSSMNRNKLYRSAIYLKEESAPQTHYNVYFDNERWDIRPVGEAGEFEFRGRKMCFRPSSYSCMRWNRLRMWGCAKFSIRRTTADFTNYLQKWRIFSNNLVFSCLCVIIIWQWRKAAANLFLCESGSVAHNSNLPLKK